MSSCIDNTVIENIAPLNGVWITIFLSKKLSISIEGFFRLIDVNGNIVFTSDDWCSSDYDETLLETLRSYAVDAQVISSRIVEKPGDLTLVLSNGNSIEIFAHSSICDSWSISGEQGTIIEVSKSRGVQKYC